MKEKIVGATVKAERNELVSKKNMNGVSVDVDNKYG